MRLLILRANTATLQVRKAYTITKQRERWTDSEHERFLQALKRYGRAWRKIEGKLQNLDASDSRHVLAICAARLSVWDLLAHGQSQKTVSCRRAHRHEDSSAD